MKPTLAPRSRALLVVESDPRAARELCVAALERGHDCAVAADAAAAITMARTHKPDAVVVSLELRDYDGRDLVQRLRRLRELDQTVVVAVSGRDEAHWRLLALELGADDCELRPIVAPVLMNRIERLIERRQDN